MIQTNPSKFEERLSSDIYLCWLCLKQGTERERERERERKGGGERGSNLELPEGISVLSLDTRITIVVVCFLFSSLYHAGME